MYNKHTVYVYVCSSYTTEDLLSIYILVDQKDRPVERICSLYAYPDVIQSSDTLHIRSTKFWQGNIDGFDGLASFRNLTGKLDVS